MRPRAPGPDHRDGRRHEGHRRVTAGERAQGLGVGVEAVHAAVAAHGQQVAEVVERVGVGRVGREDLAQHALDVGERGVHEIQN